MKAEQMRRRGGLLAVLMSVMLATPSMAGLIIEGYEEEPLLVPTEADAQALLRLSLGDAYERLKDSASLFRVVFETNGEFAAACDVDEAVTMNVGAYLEKDLDSDSRFTIHVNKDHITREMERARDQAGEAFESLPEDQRRRRLLLAARILTCTFIAHEGRHALQVLEGEVAFGEDLVGPEIHEKIAHDRYDEYSGYHAQIALRHLQGGRLPEGQRDAVHQKAVEEVNRWYSSLPKKFLISQFGQESEGEAPFPWPTADDGKRAVEAKGRMADFVSRLLGQALGGDAPEQNEAGALSTASGAADSEDEAGALARARELLGAGEDDLLDLSGVESSTLDAALEEALALGPSRDDGTAMAKAEAKGGGGHGGRGYGKDPTAGDFSP